MSTEEKEICLKNLADSQKELINTIEAASETEFLVRPADNKWSMAELVEHIILVDASILKGIKKVGATPSKEAIVSSLLIDNIVNKVTNRSRKIDAPKYFIPKGIFTNKTAAIDGFSEHRATIEAFLNTTELPLKFIGFPHPIFGMLNGLDWFVFMAGHCERHRLQMEESTVVGS